MGDAHITMTNLAQHIRVNVTAHTSYLQPLFSTQHARAQPQHKFQLKLTKAILIQKSTAKLSPSAAKQRPGDMEVDVKGAAHCSFARCQKLSGAKGSRFWDAQMTEATSWIFCPSSAMPATRSFARRCALVNSKPCKDIFFPKQCGHTMGFLR